MFEKTRLKLTAWYLLIIMAVSIFFSIFIFQVADRELTRIDRRQRDFRERIRIEIFQRGFPQEFNIAVDVEELRHRIIFMLFLVNSFILVLAGGAGYFLAGRTMRPIKDMVDEQNRFITDSSHELRTPLTSLKSAMEVHLRDKNLTLGECKKLIADNIKEVDSLQKLSDSLLQLAAYQNNKSTLHFEKVSLKKTVAAAIVKLKFQSDEKKLKMKNDCSDVEIMADRDKLQDLLVILFDNSIKYSPPGKTVTVSAVRKDGSVRLTVTDQGMGIEKKDIPFIFDRFYRAGVSRSKKSVAGYGLGLSIAKKIVKMHKGEISAQSKAGAGAVFTVTLPVGQTISG